MLRDVVCDGLAALTPPGSRGASLRDPRHRGAVRELGLEIARIEPPEPLHGSDVLQVGT